ncbi:MAG: undecaprenyl/decaprenyl-phosphate alpha-N-acetylglucosaminyl 1-phosphate transferase [Planctomycetes bacterium]|nr:undecaprenyl/decaprenyl-phosphate alpha-N-acetylglucosaminyl 1-phosphate transferase [Planctomycetota bacterium]
MTALLITAFLAFLASVSLTPSVIRASRRFGLVDKPDVDRKLHRQAVPLGGGVAVLVAGALSLTVLLSVDSAWSQVLRKDAFFLAGLACSAVVICGVGLLDDRVALKGRQKLAGQIAAVTILMVSGLLVRNVEILGWNVHLGLLAVPFTLFWMLGAINALNLLDGADGVAGGVGVTLSLAVACLAALTGHQTDAAVALVMAGSLMGFLNYNLPPARIFLGDSGSMLIGLVVGAIAMRASLVAPATVALVPPTVILAIPILDATMAILRRKLTGRSLYIADRAHLHHRLQQLGLGGLAIAASISALSACTAMGALASVYYHHEALALAVAAIVTGLLVATRVFGYTECSLLCRRLRTFVWSLIPLHDDTATQSRQSCTHLQGSGQWEKAWSALVEFAEGAELSMVQLNITVSALHEDYHGLWETADRGDRGQPWQVEFPLVIRSMNVGCLRMAGVMNGESVGSRIAHVGTAVKALEETLSSLLEGRRTAKGKRYFRDPPHGVPAPTQARSLPSRRSRPVPAADSVGDRSQDGYSES